jgi:hypothetical protein
MGHLQEDTRTVTGVGFTATGTAMVQIPQDLQAILNRLVGSFALYIDNKPYTTGIVLKPGIVKPLLGR